jgi:hypothetical protein
MGKKDLLLKAYLGETIPGLIHNVGNPLGAMLGFVSIMREEVSWLRHDMESFPEEKLRERVQESLAKITELFDFAARSEQSLRKAVEKMVVKCNKDLDHEESIFDVNELLRVESDVLMTNAFFKHKIAKKIEYCQTALHVRAVWRDLSQPVGSILFRYTIVLTKVAKPRLLVRTSGSPEGVRIEFESNAALTEDDLSASPNVFLPALTLAECQDMLRALGTLTYAGTADGGSIVSLTLFPFTRKDAIVEPFTGLPGGNPFSAIDVALRAASSPDRLRPE